MARSVSDAAQLLQVIAGADPNDNYTSAIPNGGQLPDYSAALKNDSLSGAKFGVARNIFSVFEDNTTGPVLDAFEKSLDVIRSAGATIVDANFTGLETYIANGSQSETIVLGSEFISGLAEYLAELTYNPLGVTSLEDVRNFTVSFPAEEYPSRNVRVWDEALALGYNASDIRHFQAVQMDKMIGTQSGVPGALMNQSLDAILLPTAFAPPVAAIVGNPVVTVPMGFYPPNTTVTPNQRGNLVAVGPNIPYVEAIASPVVFIALTDGRARFGFSFLGDAYSEASLISYAYAFEQRTMVRNMIQPYIVPNTEVADVVGG